MSGCNATPWVRLLQPAAERAISRHSNRGLPWRHGRRSRRGGQVSRLADERGAAAELLGIDQHQENGTAPAGLLRVAPVAGQRARDGFEQDTKREALVAEVGATERIERASLVIDERPRIVARMAVARDEPWPGKTLPGSCCAHAYRCCGRRRADVDEDRFVLGWNSGRDWVGAVDRLDRAGRRDPPRRRVRACKDDEQAVVDDRLQERLQAGNVMAPTDDDGRHRMLGEPRPRFGDRAPDEPRSGEVVAVPRQRRAMIGDDARVTGDGHASAANLLEVAWQESEAVRGMSEEVALEEDLGDILRAVVGQSCGHEQGVRVAEERGSRKSS